MDISFDVLPRVAPPDGTDHIFEIRENQHGIEAGVINYVFDPNVVIDWKKVIPEWPIFGVSKGEITSTTSDAVFYAVIPLTLGFQEMLPDPDHPNQSRSGALVTVQNASFAVGRIRQMTRMSSTS